MAHFAGLVAARVSTPTRCPTPTSSPAPSHKTARRPAAAAVIFCKEEYAKKINSAVFPGLQGGPLEARDRGPRRSRSRSPASDPLQGAPAAHHRGGAKAFGEGAAQPADKVNVADRGGRTFTWWLADLRRTSEARRQAGRGPGLARRRHHRQPATRCRSTRVRPMVTSGLRIGTPALATRGLAGRRLSPRSSGGSSGPGRCSPASRTVRAELGRARSTRDPPTAIPLYFAPAAPGSGLGKPASSAVGAGCNPSAPMARVTLLRSRRGHPLLGHEPLTRGPRSSVQVCWSPAPRLLVRRIDLVDEGRNARPPRRRSRPTSRSRPRRRTARRSWCGQESPSCCGA